MMQKVFLGPLNNKWADIEDLTTREWVSIVPLAVLTVAIGVWPSWVFNLMNTTLIHMAGLIKQ